MNKRILISTGGSGGHVVPATIFYEHLKDKFDIFLSTDRRGIQFLDKKQNDIKIINTPKLSKNIFLIPFQVVLLFFTVIKSFFFLKKNKIEILISTGGYMSLPLCVASRALNIKLFLFEPNMVLGRSNKFFINYCKKIFCYSDNIKKFPSKFKNRISLIPPLLREKFYDIEKNSNLSNKINLLIIGGSQGAKLFDSIIDTIIEINKKYELKVFQQTNSKNLKNTYLLNNIKNELFDFNEDISNYMNKSNICITRAGASTLAELTFLNIPHIAIPLSSAKDNHQFENAHFYEQQGCNWIMNQNEITKISLTQKLVNIIENKEEYLDKKKNMKNLTYENTWNNINQKIINTINEN
jgi:UDP-N-acetylglucosamine--N-acetylmuramyl-(pentapeptide) pyrophosphoryl-undecaprenol N-acetylglucosamine transferase